MSIMGLVSTGRVYPVTAQKGFEGTELVLQMCAQSGLTKELVCGASRNPEVVLIRHLIMAALYVRGYSTPRIGHMLGGRDHTTVVAAMRKLGLPLYGKGNKGHDARLAAIAAGELK